MLGELYGYLAVWRVGKPSWAARMEAGKPSRAALVGEPVQLVFRVFSHSVLLGLKVLLLHLLVVVRFSANALHLLAGAGVLRKCSFFQSSVSLGVWSLTWKPGKSTWGATAIPREL